MWFTFLSQAADNILFWKRCKPLILLFRCDVFLHQIYPWESEIQNAEAFCYKIQLPSHSFSEESVLTPQVSVECSVRDRHFQNSSASAVHVQTDWLPDRLSGSKRKAEKTVAEQARRVDEMISWASSRLVFCPLGIPSSHTRVGFVVCSFTFCILPRSLALKRELHCLAQPSSNLSWANANHSQDCGVPTLQEGNTNFPAASYQNVGCPCPSCVSFLTKVMVALSGETSWLESQFCTATGQKRALCASYRLASSIRGRRWQYFGWRASFETSQLGEVWSQLEKCFVLQGL